MTHREAVRIAKPTIAEVLAEFLAEQQGRLSSRTFGSYEEVIELLQHSLNGYAYESLDEAEAQLFDRLHNAEGAEHREFCDIFGPQHILPNVGEFLDYFMVRKVIAGKELLRAAGTVTKKLAAWLAEKGYVSTGSNKARAVSSWSGRLTSRPRLLPALSRPGRPAEAAGRDLDKAEAGYSAGCFRRTS